MKYFILIISLILILIYVKSQETFIENRVNEVLSINQNKINKIRNNKEEIKICNFKRGSGLLDGIIRDVAYDDSLGIYISVGYSGKGKNSHILIATSDDGEYWEEVYPDTPFQDGRLYSISVNDGFAIAVGLSSKGRQITLIANAIGNGDYPYVDWVQFETVKGVKFGSCITYDGTAYSVGNIINPSTNLRDTPQKRIQESILRRDFDGNWNPIKLNSFSGDQIPLETKILKSVACTGLDIVVIGGSMNKIQAIWNSYDGGDSFSNVKLFNRGTINDITIHNRRNIYACGNDFVSTMTSGIIVGSDDKGRSWSILQQFEGKLFGITMINKLHGYVCGEDIDGFGILYSTFTGWKSKARFESQRESTLYSLTYNKADDDNNNNNIIDNPKEVIVVGASTDRNGDERSISYYCKQNTNRIKEKIRNNRDINIVRKLQENTDDTIDANGKSLKFKNDENKNSRYEDRDRDNKNNIIDSYWHTHLHKHKRNRDYDENERMHDDEDIDYYGDDYIKEDEEEDFDDIDHEEYYDIVRDKSNLAYQKRGHKVEEEYDKYKRHRDNDENERMYDEEEYDYFDDEYIEEDEEDEEDFDDTEDTEETSMNFGEWWNHRSEFNGNNYRIKHKADRNGGHFEEIVYSLDDGGNN